MTNALIAELYIVSAFNHQGSDTNDWFVSLQLSIPFEGVQHLHR